MPETQLAIAIKNNKKYYNYIKVDDTTIVFFCFYKCYFKATGHYLK